MNLDLSMWQGTVENLGWTLVHFLWQGALMALLFAAAMRLLRGRSPAARYATGYALFIVMATLPVITMLILESATPGGGGPLIPLEQPASVVAGSAAVSGGLPPIIDSGRVWLEAALPWTVVAWIIGVLFLSLRLGLEWRATRALAFRGTSTLPAQIQRMVDDWCDSLAIRQRVTALASAIAPCPTVIGWLRPVILIPTGALLRLTPEQLEMIIVHELAHIRRHDYIANLFQVAVETILFYHPVVRRMSERIRDEREKCCDDVVVCDHDAHFYARALADLEQFRGAGSPQFSVAADGGQLLDRIYRLVSRPKPARGSAVWVLGLLAGGAFVTVTAATHLPANGVLPATAPVSVVEAVADIEPVAMVGSRPALAVSEPAIPTPAAEPARPVGAAAPAPDAEPDRAPPAVAEPAPEPVRVAMAVTAPTAAPAPEPARAPETVHEPEPETTGSNTPPEPVAPAAPARLSHIAPADPYGSPAQTPVTPMLTARNITGGSIIEMYDPVYPEKELFRDREGSVSLEFTVTETGRVRAIRVIDSTPGNGFQRAAKAAIRKWRFEPFVRDGQAVARRVEKTFEFRLSDEHDRCEPATGSRICDD